MDYLAMYQQTTRSDKPKKVVHSMNEQYEAGKLDGRFDLACQILDILNNEQLDMLKQIVKIRQLSTKIARSKGT